VLLNLANMFSIVEFELDKEIANEVAVAPSCWIKGDHCLWPTFRNPDSIRAAVRKCELPKKTSNWKLWKILRVMKNFDS
ncbi:unnamed protein product, partial [Allacma fusca]